MEAVGLGAAGMVEWPGGQARWAPHNTYRRMELRHLLHERTGLPTMVDNDVNVAAWAEARFGGRVVTDDLVLVTVGKFDRRRAGPGRPPSTARTGSRASSGT